MNGLIIGLLAMLFAIVFVVAFLRGAHADDDNPLGEEAAHPTAIEKERNRAA